MLGYPVNGDILNKKRSMMTTNLERELWVFWLSDKSQLKDHGLEKLTECQSGSLAWDSVFQYSSTPLSSGSPQTPRPTAMSASANDMASSSREYEIFISGLRNVLDRGMVSKGGYRLGESYVFPSSLQPRLDSSVLPSFPKISSLAMLSCTIAMYLSASNLVFQPTFQYHRLRTLTTMDLDTRLTPRNDLEVLLSPHGTRAVLRPSEMSEFTEEQTERCVEGWSYLFGSNSESTQDHPDPLPRLVSVCVQAGRNELLIQYPSERVFVPVSCKESPNDVGELDGMGSRNLGLVEDLGAKFALWSWQERTRNAIASPAVPKLVQPVSDNTPVLAEPRNRLKAGSSAWQQQQHQLQQQQLQQQQQQQLQQQQQNFFLQQQQEAFLRRTTNAGHYDTNRIDYWSYMDPYAYLTSIVLNSCANAEPRAADSPSAGDNQVMISTPSISVLAAQSTSSLTIKKEEDGWIRARPKKNVMASIQSHSLHAVETSIASTVAWASGANAGANQATTGASNGDSSNHTSDTKSSEIPADAQSVNTSLNNTSYQLPIDIPADDNDIMSGLNDMESMLGLSGGNSGDLDWDEVTNEDFSFFDTQPRAPVRAPPVAISSSFGVNSLQSSIPISSSALPVIPSSHSHTAISSTDGLTSAYSDPFASSSASNPLDDDSLFSNMDLDLSLFTQPTPPASAPVSIATMENKALIITNGAFSDSPMPSDPLTLNQPMHDISMLTPAPQPSDGALVIAAQSPVLDEITTPGEVSVIKKRPSILVEHVHSPIQSYIPSSFSPLKVVGELLVDESKYQAGGRFMYRRLYKRKKATSRDSTQNRRESRQLPYYRPGKDQEWIVPHRKERPHRAKRIKLERSPLSTSFPVSTIDRQQKAILPNISTTAWGIAALSLQPFNKRTPDGSVSSDSESGSSSGSSSDDSVDDSSTPTTPRPTFGKVSSRPKVPLSWTVRGINSAKLAATVLAQSLEKSTGGILLGVSPRIQKGKEVSDDKSWFTESDSNLTEARTPWSSTDSYHANVEFDTPFMPAVLSAAPPALVHEAMTVQESLAAEYFLETVRTLCEQGIVGDYPFAGSNEVTGTSGEISEGESFHLMLARRKTLLQQIRDGVATVPALGDESFRNLMEMKTIIFDLFDHLRGNRGDDSMVLPIPSDASQDMAMSLGHHHHSSQSNITPPVVMRGPLTLLQLHTLAEVQQTPSKYGKYQVKKKKPAEPAILQLPPPDIVVGHNEEWLEASPTILRFWEKLSLEPYSSKKNIAYFVVYPEGPDMENSVTKFWRELSVIFETSLLGSHQPGNMQEYKSGLVPISLLPALVGESTEARQVRSYVDGCQRLGLILGGISQRRDLHTVIYMVNPFSHGSGYYDLCRCFSIMKTQFRTAALGSLLTPVEQQRERLVMQLVPIQHVLYPSTFGGYLRFGLRDIAFTVYDKCKIFMERPTYSGGSMAQLNAYAPSFALAKTAPQSVNFDLHQTPNSVPKPAATLHVGYGFSLDGRWLICVWTDHRGEMLEHVALDMKGGHTARFNSRPQQQHQLDPSVQCGRRTLMSCLDEIWMKSKIYQKRGSFTWKTVICKLGVMSQIELREWARLVEGHAHVSIVAVNVDSPLRMYPHNRGADYLVAGMTPNNGSGIQTPNSASVSAAGISGTPMQGTASMVSTPLSQSMLPGHMSSSTAMSTPDANVTTPSTPMSGGVNGTTGLGLGIGVPGSAAGGAGRTPIAGTQAASASGGMGGIGGLTGNETLENSAGQVYAMILNHRMPIVVSREDAGVAGVVAGEPVDQNRPSKQPRSRVVSSTAGIVQSTRPLQNKRQQKTVSYPGADEDSEMEEGAILSPSAEQDEEMEDTEFSSLETSVKREEEESSTDVKSENEPAPSAVPVSAASQTTISPGREVVLPLTSGYLIQVPIQSNSVIRDKRCLESLGIEVHLLHLQRAVPAGISTVTTGPGNGTPGAPSTLSLLTGSPTGSSYPLHQLGQGQGPPQHSTAYHLQRHTPQSPSLSSSRPLSSAQHLASISASSPSMSSSLPSSPFVHHHQRHTSSGSVGGGAQSSLGLGVSVPGGMTSTTVTGMTTPASTVIIPGTVGVKPTVAANATREILKQFHALSHLSLAPVQTNCLPNHLILVERLSRVLLLVQD
ncbi:mediator of RNA polymerase II transcription subunit 13 [Gryganskiella cystojenkinii]|nr:mediator of RNA polymerase II transcription subunit 13 [Gryganskiella cystojenkinii]